MLAPIAGPTTISRAGDGTPLVTAAAGTSLHDLMASLLAERLFVPVTPGTRYVTVGGAVAADIHGKNHHRDGTFGAQVVSLDLVTADGALHTIGPDADPALFWATVGGMGLTGVITSVTLRALPVESAYVTVRTERIAGLDALMRTMREHDDDHRYSVAWIDTLARGRSLGRSVLTRGDHATEAELTGAAARHPWRAPRPPRLARPAHAARRAGVAPGCARLQRAVVPQGAPRPGRRRVDRVVLPPARPGRRAGTGSMAGAGWSSTSSSSPSTPRPL